MDAASLGLAIRDCKERGFDRLTYAPSTIGNYFCLASCQILFMQGETGNNPADNKATENSKNKQGDNVSSPDGNDFIKAAIPPFWLFVTDGLLVVLLWMLSEWFFKYNHETLAAVNLFLAIEVALAGLVYGLYKIWPNLKTALMIFVLFSIGLAFIPFKNSRSQKVAVAPIVKWQPPDLGNNQDGLGTLECGKMIPWAFTAGAPVLGIQSDVQTNGKPAYYVLQMPDSTNQIPVGVSLINNRFYIDATVPIDGTNLMTIHGIVVTKIYGMEAYPDCLPWKWDLNYSPDALEFVDGDNDPMLQVIYLRPNRIAVRGYVAVGSRYLILGEKTVFRGNLPIDKSKGDLKPLFKYPSALHKGEYAK